MGFKMIKLKFYKKYYILTSLVGILALSLGACGGGPPEHDCFFVQNSAGHRVSWNQNLPVTLWIHDVPHEYRDAFYKSEEIFEEKFNTNFFTFQEIDAALSDTNRNDNRSIIYWDETWAEEESEQAKTTIHWIGSQITDADIRFNANHYSYYTGKNIEENLGGEALEGISYASTGYRNVLTQMANFGIGDIGQNVSDHRHIHLESLIIHELGHVLGLKHNDDKSSIMQRTLSGQVERDVIGDSDYKNVQCEYGHSHSHA